MGRACGPSGTPAKGIRARFSTATDVSTVRKLHPELTLLQDVSDESRIIVSEPLGDLSGAWNEVPESSYGVVQEGDDEMRPFRPVKP